MKYKTWYNYKLNKEGMEKNGLPSETIPGQSYTIRELLEKFTHGVSPAVAKIPTYDPDQGFDDVDPTSAPDFDLADVTILLEDIKQKQSERSEQIKQANITAKKDADAKKSDDDRREEDRIKAEASQK